MGTSTPYPTQRSGQLRGNVNDAYTYAQLSALAAAGDLTPNSWYVAADSEVRYWASDASTLQVDVSASPRVSNRFALRKSLSRLARSYSAQSTVGVLGHSVVSGAYSNDAVSSVDATWNDTGWVAVLRKMFATQYGTASLRGLLHPAENLSTNFTLAGGAAFNGPNNTVGVEGYRIDLAAAGNTVSVSGTGRYLRVWGFSTAAGVAARYTIDGGSLTTSGTVSAGASPNGQFWYTFDIDCTTDAAHTVVLQGAASGSWYLFACAFLAQTASGVLVHRMGRSGAVLPNLLAESLDGTDTAGPAWRTLLTANGKLQQAHSLTSQLGINLMMVMVDANDLTGGWTTYGYTLADVRRHAQNAVTSLVARGCDVLFVTGLWRDPAAYGIGAPFDHSQVIQQYASVAADNDYCAHLDLTSVWADYAAVNAAGLMQDTVHPNSLGHAWMADAVFRALTA